jgi:hypothetical protein
MFLVTGCSGPATVARPPAPDLQLLESSPLQLARDCQPRAGEVYRAEFDVRPDGRVDNIRTTGDAACANEALEKWVASFRYNVRADSVTTVVDWMLVEAPREG